MRHGRRKDRKKNNSWVRTSGARGSCKCSVIMYLWQILWYEDIEKKLFTPFLAQTCGETARCCKPPAPAPERICGLCVLCVISEKNDRNESKYLTLADTDESSSALLAFETFWQKRSVWKPFGHPRVFFFFFHIQRVSQRFPFEDQRFVFDNPDEVCHSRRSVLK